MAKRFLSHWQGILLSLVSIVATFWLAITNQLGLYIHPRYDVFTVVMTAIAAIFVLLAFALLPNTVADTLHQDAHTDQRQPQTIKWLTALSVMLVVVSVVALLIIPPATLTTSTAEQRDINGSVTTISPGDSVNLVGGDYTSFTVRDWAGLLRQGADEDYFAGKIPTLVGFITPDADDPDNVFYVARFVVTCCAVDAQPIGVPVYLPSWQKQYNTDDWVSVSGSFIANPSINSKQNLVLQPAKITITAQPAQPYVY